MSRWPIVRVCEDRSRGAKSETSFPNEDVGGALSEPEGSSISCGHWVCREILCVCACVYVILDDWSDPVQFTVCVCVVVLVEF